MKQLWLEGPWLGEELPVDSATRHRLRKVLRLRAGAKLTIADGAGTRQQCEWTGQQLRCLSVPETTAAPRAPITVALGILKGPRWQIALEKLTELGVDRIVPLELSHCVASIAAKQREAKTDKWRAVTCEAFEQCGRAYLPAIAAPVTLSQLLTGSQAEIGGAPANAGRAVTLLFGDSDRRQGAGRLPSLAPLRGPVTIVIGPEGGLAKSEVEQLRAAGAIGMSLGPHVLRAETAAIAAMAVLATLRTSD